MSRLVISYNTAHKTRLQLDPRISPSVFPTFTFHLLPSSSLFPCHAKMAGPLTTDVDGDEVNSTGVGSLLSSLEHAESFSVSSFPSLNDLLRIYCRERLFVHPLKWTNRQFELLQCSFVSRKPGYRPAQQAFSYLPLSSSPPSSAKSESDEYSSTDENEPEGNTGAHSLADAVSSIQSRGDGNNRMYAAVLLHSGPLVFDLDR